MKIRGLIGLAAVCLSVAAVADDGWIGFTGSPKMMGSHPTIRMVSEIVRVTIHRETADVECDFLFQNLGGKSVARMGFPDYDEFADSGEKLKSTYNFFRSYVDGVRAPTRLEPEFAPKVEGGGETSYEAYQVKSIVFGKGQTRRVRDVYRLNLGTLSLAEAGHSDPTPAYSTFNYIFSTGSTWRGTIGRAEIVITFAKDASVQGALLHHSAAPSEKENHFAWWSKHRAFIVGAGDFAIKGRTLRMVKRNWKPTTDDDISLSFGLYYRR